MTKPIIVVKICYKLPYTAKLSSGKTFAVFAVFCSTANVLRRIC